MRLNIAEYCVKNCFRQNIYKFPIGSLRKLRNVFLLGIQQNVVGLLRGSNYLSFWNLPSIVSSCTLLKIWIWSLCVSIFVWYNRMPTELQSVCSTETWAGLIGHEFLSWKRLVLIIIFITNFVFSWSAEPLKKNLPSLTSFDHWYYKDILSTVATFICFVCCLFLMTMAIELVLFYQFFILSLSVDMDCWQNYRSGLYQAENGFWCFISGWFADYCHNWCLQQAHGNICYYNECVNLKTVIDT